MHEVMSEWQAPFHAFPLRLTRHSNEGINDLSGANPA
jgi:hypothetical protein